MRRLLQDHDRLALEEGTAERLLTGLLDPADAPPGYGPGGGGAGGGGGLCSSGALKFPPAAYPPGGLVWLRSC
jgi:hypothetical protein